MLIIPEIQIQGGKVITRSASQDNDVIHDILPMEALKKFVDADAQNDSDSRYRCRSLEANK